VIDIVITVAVTVAIAALAASGVGLLAAIALAALIGAAGGLLKQAANDMIDGKTSSWQDYAMQAGIGAATGVLQLVGIRGADKAFGAISNTVGKYAAKYAIETATDTVIDVGTRVASGEQFSLQMLGSSVASSLLSNVGGDLLKGGFGKLGKKLDLDKVDNKLFKAGTEFATDTIADTAIDVADKTLIKGEKFSLEMLGESAGTSALSNLAAAGAKAGANKLYGDKLRSLGSDKSKVDNTTSKPKNLTDNDDHRNKQLTPERKAELEQKLENRKLNKEEWKELDRDRRISEKQNNTESSIPKKANQDGNERTQHQDKQEIEPGIVAKEKTADGHEIKVLKDGRVVKCSTCGEIQQKYEKQLKENPELQTRLNEIEKISNPEEKAKQAKQLEQELAHTTVKQNNLEEGRKLIGQNIKDIKNKRLPGYIIKDGKLSTRKGGILQRRNKNSGHPKLTVDKDGIISEDSKRQRISNQRKAVKNAGGPKENHQVHHLIPDAVVGKHPLTEAAMKRGNPPYDLNEKSNLMYLPSNSKGQRQKESHNLPIHNGSHEPWNKHAENILNSKLAKLIRVYGSIDNVPGHVLTKSVKNVEIKLEADIRTWKVIRR
jgi:hypothetical protein